MPIHSPTESTEVKSPKYFNAIGIQIFRIRLHPYSNFSNIVWKEKKLFFRDVSYQLCTRLYMLIFSYPKLSNFATCKSLSFPAQWNSGYYRYMFRLYYSKLNFIPPYTIQQCSANMCKQSDCKMDHACLPFIIQIKLFAMLEKAWIELS